MRAATVTPVDAVFRQLGLQVLERGWLSANNIVFAESGGTATVVDTGYDSHAVQTLSLVDHALGGRQLQRIVNTHLHSDHCGGNAHLQREGDVQTWIPAVSLDAVRRWDADRLTYVLTGQTCQRFAADRGLEPGEEIELGGYRWQVLAALGHDPEALMYFQPDSRVLISGDALWEERLAIIFPELDGRSGFAEAMGSLDAIEQLAPSIVIPGHGPPFTDVPSALARSRQRLGAFQREPDKHLRYGARALVMFRMMDLQACGFDELVDWLRTAPVFQALQAGRDADESRAEAIRLVERLVDDGQLGLRSDGTVSVPAR